MADISHIKGPDNTSYDIKDATARSDLTDKISRSGDTMTGSLRAIAFTALAAGSPKVSSQSTDVDASKADNNVSTDHYPGLETADKFGRILTRTECVASSNGNIAAYWYVRNYNTSGSQVAQKGIKITMAKDGSIAYSVDDASKFRTAIDALCKSGDTMTGNLSVKSASMPANPTSGNLYLNGLYLQDVSDDGYAYLRAHSASAEKGLQLEVRRLVNGSYTFNTLNMRINASGGKIIQVSDGGAWRSAIGAQATLSNSDLSYTRVNGNVSNDAKCRRYGNIVEFTGQFGLSSSSLARDTILWNGFPKPKTVVYFTARCEGNWNTYSFYISTNGEIKNQQASIPAGTYNCNLVYICQ